VSTRHLSTRQRILDYITTYIEQHGASPSIREVAAGARCSVSNTYRHVCKLAQAGKITRAPHRARSIKLVPQEVEV
jgi:SOS-response transcriptional repressor LexA